MEVFTLATSAEEIVGTWHEGSLYIRFDEDGAFRQAFALDKLDSRPYAISSYRFEGTKMVTSEISVSDVPSCGNRIGSYEIRMLENGNIEIVTIQDQCRPRAGDISGEKEPVESPSPGGSVNLQNGLVAYYPFDGDANDSSSNGHHGTVVGATLTADRNGEDGKAYSFDGEDDFVSIADSPEFDFGDGDMTVLAWVLYDGDESWRGVNFYGLVSHTDGLDASDGWVWSMG